MLMLMTDYKKPLHIMISISHFRFFPSRYCQQIQNQNRRHFAGRSAVIKSRSFYRAVLNLRDSVTRKKNPILFFILLCCLFLSPCLSAEAAASTIPEPNDGEVELLILFAKFDGLYVERQAGRMVSGKKWLNIGERLLKSLGDMGEKLSNKWPDMDGELSQAWITYTMQHNVGMNFMLRAALIMGECFLFASQEYFGSNDTFFVEYYERGIITLEQVIVASEKLAEKYSKNQAEIIYLPTYTQRIQQGLRFDFHRFAGFETIGTGFEEAIGVVRRKITYDITSYYDLDKYRNVLTTDIQITQISTTHTARDFLSHFCPWGVQMFFGLKNAGLTSDLDFSILRPYAAGRDKSFHDKMIQNADSFFSSRRKYIPIWDIPPLVSDISLSADKIPANIREEMDLVVGEKTGNFGDRRSRSGRNYRIHKGTIGDLGDKQIRWLWVGDPTYNIWYLSPTIYNWQVSDYAFAIFSLYKWASGGMMWGAVSIGMDSLGGKLTKELMESLGVSPVPVPFLSNIATERIKDSFGSKTGEKISLNGTIEKGKWIDPASFYMDVATYVFDSMESSQRKGLFGITGNVSPQNNKMGQTYDGSNMVPILLCANVTGVQDVPEDEYHRLVNVVRFYVLYPSIQEDSEGKRLRYDLKGSSLLGFRNKVKRSFGWSRIGCPFASYQTATSFAPMAQNLMFSLDEKSLDALRGYEEFMNSQIHRTRASLLTPPSSRHRVEAELWTVSPLEQKKYASVLLYEKGLNPLGTFSIKLLDSEKPLSQTMYRRGRRPRSAEYQRQNPKVLVPLKTRYELKLKVNGNYLKRDAEDKYFVNLDLGPWSKPEDKKEITGKLISDSSGYLNLVYDRKIELLSAKVKTGSVKQGRKP